MGALLSDQEVIERIFNHIDNGTTDLGDADWQEPIEHYSSVERLQEELALFRRMPIPFCPSAAIPQDEGSYVAHISAGVPIVVIRDKDGTLRGFQNVCRHRGKQLLQGEGCSKAIVCGYHGWAYKLDGRLQYIPHDGGFPNLDKDDYGLVPVHVAERNGMVFVNQEAPIEDEFLDGLPPLLNEEQKIFRTYDGVSDVNWKLNMEATLEGYHIKPTHKETFYPYGYDNLNVVETYGQHTRVTFPFRRIEKLRDVPVEERDISGNVTYVYHVFPIGTVAMLSSHTVVTISEPLAPDRTRFYTYRLTNDAPGKQVSKAKAEKDADFVDDTGNKEDAEVVRQIQAGLASTANTHFVYGRNEKGIVHFHQNLSACLD